MARLILKSPYLKPNGKRSPGGYLKYIATREGVEMAEDISRHLPATSEQKKEITRMLKKHPDTKDSHEYQDYLDNPTRSNADALLSAVYELHGGTPQRDIYLKYISERPGVEKLGSNGLFTDEGIPIVLAQVQKEMNECQSNIWAHIISLHREDAERLGYNTPETWMHLLRSQRNYIAQQMRISPDNFRWYAAFHNEGHHPHIHMMAYSIDPHEAYLSPKGIENIKSSLAKEIFQQDLLQIYEKQTAVRDELRQEGRNRIAQIVEEINAGDFQNQDLQLLLIQLADSLSKVKGKKVYGYLNAETKKLVDSIVAELAKDSLIQELYRLWYVQKNDILRTYTNKSSERIPLEQNKEFKSIQNAVIQAALDIRIPQEEPSLSAPCSPCVDFPDDGSDVYPKAVKTLHAPEVDPDPEVKQFLHEAAIRGSVDAVYGIRRIYEKSDIRKAISMYELAASQGNSYAEYQLGKICCYGNGIPRDLETGMDWLKTSADHGNKYAATMLHHVQTYLSESTIKTSFSLLQALAKLIQDDHEQQHRKFLRIDKKQRQKIEEKKQAQGLRSSSGIEQQM